MIKLNNPPQSAYKSISKRPKKNKPDLDSTISLIFDSVEENGDEALKYFTKQFDKVDITSIRVPDEDLFLAYKNLDKQLIESLTQSKNNIEYFHNSQIPHNIKLDNGSGVILEQKAVPIERIGIYIPGGTAPLLSTILMLAIPAKIANCSEIVLCSPPSHYGKIHPSILGTAYYMGITEVYQVGGAQAIAGMAIGTKSIFPVQKIFGPGNAYVTAAKEFLNKYGVAFDLPAGPSELLIYTDGTGNPSFITADLLSQAEHGEDSQVILVTTDEKSVPLIEEALELQISSLPRKAIAKKALANSVILIVQNKEQAFQFINEYAPEHLIIACKNPQNYIPLIRNAGSVFLGNYCPEAAGDYASGTNHTLPTDGWAKSFSGVNLDSFYKKITFQYMEKDGLKTLAKTITTLAREEGLEAHARAVEIRLSQKSLS